MKIPCIKTYILIYFVIPSYRNAFKNNILDMFVYVANSIDNCLVQERG